MTATTDVSATASEDRWPALESSSEAFTALLHKLLRPAASPSSSSSSSDATASASSPYSFQDVFSLDKDCLAFVPGETLALILAYDHSAIPAASTEAAASSSSSSSSSSIPPQHVVFIKQLPTLDNACGTIALIHAALNALPPSVVPPDSVLASLVPPGGEGAGSEEMGRRLDTHGAIHAAHCECAAQGHTEQVQGDAVQYHFVCLFPAAPSSPHTIIELDGLKSAPIVHVLEKEGKEEEGKEGEGGENGKESFLLCGAKVLQRKFLARFANPEETAMNVLALVREEEEEGEGEGEA